MPYTSAVLYVEFKLHSTKPMDQTISEKVKSQIYYIYTKKKPKRKEENSEREKSPRKAQVPKVHSKKEKRTGHSG